MYSPKTPLPPSPEPPGKNFSFDVLRRRAFSWPTLAGVVIGAAIIAFALWRLFDFEWDELIQSFQNINPVSYILAGLFYYSSFAVRGLRWRLIAANADIKAKKELPGIFTMAIMILSGWFLNAVAFFRAGDAYRGWILAREARAQAAPSLGSVAAERAQDILAVLFLVLASALWLTFSGSGVEVPRVVVLGAFILTGLLALGISAIWIFGEKLPLPLPKVILNRYLDFRVATLKGVSGRSTLPQMLLGLLGWIMEALRFYFVSDAIGLGVGLALALMAALAVAMLTTIPTPGGFGFVETGLTGLLILLNFSDSDAIALTAADRLVSWVSVIIFGGTAFFVWHFVRYRRRQRKKEEKRDIIGNGDQGL